MTRTIILQLPEGVQRISRSLVGNTDGIADAIRTSTYTNEYVLLVGDLLLIKE